MQGSINVLFDKLPTELKVDGVYYPIYSDHKTSLVFTELNSDMEISVEDRVYATLNLYYKELPRNIAEAYRQVCLFYGRGATGSGGSRQVICFTQDADYIYSAFYSQYGIDLNAELLHWWKFLSLLKGLKRDEMISEIMHIRSVPMDNTLSKDLRNHYRKLKSIYRIKSNNEITDEAIGKAFGG